VQIAAGAVLLLPVRAVVLVFMLAAYIAIAWLLSLLASGGRPRTALRAVTSLFLRVGFFVGGVRLHIRGKREVVMLSPSRVFRALTDTHPSTQATGTIVSNHCSYLDVLIHAYLSFPSFVAKVSLSVLSPLAGCLALTQPSARSEERVVLGLPFALARLSLRSTCKVGPGHDSQVPKPSSPSSAGIL
jgi:lysophosphatidylcholine acyltransferase/lyso-PAF acetyltransferase